MHGVIEFHLEGLRFEGKPVRRHVGGYLPSAESPDLFEL